MKYTLEFTREADEDINLISRSYPKSVRNKLRKILNELIDHPMTGIGKPEKLKNSTYWSRRLTDKDRVRYYIDDNKVIVIMISCLGHYDDK